MYIADTTVEVIIIDHLRQTTPVINQSKLAVRLIYTFIGNMLSAFNATPISNAPVANHSTHLQKSSLRFLFILSYTSQVYLLVQTLYL